MQNWYASPFKAQEKTGWLIYSNKGLYELKLPIQNQPQPKNTQLKKHPLSKIIEDYFMGQKVIFNAKIDFSGYAPFTKIVLNKCLLVDYGSKISYKELAQAAGNKNASRAVANALGKNRLPVIIPCHRVLKSDGSLGGFANGPEIKKQLLELENDGSKT